MRPGLDAAVDQLVLDLLNVKDFQARPNAADAVAVLRKQLGSSNGVVSPQPLETTSTSIDFAPGDVIDRKFRVECEVGTGAFSRVFKVYHLEHGRHYALKLLKNLAEADELIREWNDIGVTLAPHPNIARTFWMDRLDLHEVRLTF